MYGTGEMPTGREHGLNACVRARTPTATQKQRHKVSSDKGKRRQAADSAHVTPTETCGSVDTGTELNQRRHGIWLHTRACGSEFGQCASQNGISTAPRSTWPNMQAMCMAEIPRFWKSDFFASLALAESSERT